MRRLTTGRWRHVPAVLALVVVTSFFSSGLVVGKTYSDVNRFQRLVYPWGNEAHPAPRFIHYDQAKSFYPWQTLVNRAWRDGEVPLWNPYAFTGIPFLAASANNALYPPRVGLSLVASPARVHDLIVAGHMFVAGLAMYALLVYFGLSVHAGLLGAVSWMASSFMLTWSALDHFVVVAALLPLAILLMDVAVRRRSWLASLSLGVILALLFLGGYALFVELCFVVIGAYGVGVLAAGLLASRRVSGGIRTLDVLSGVGRIALPWVLLVGLTAPVLLPILELVEASSRAPLSYSELAKYRLPLSDLVAILVPPPVGFRSTVQDPYHTALFGGSAVALLAILGLNARRSVAQLSRVLVLITLSVAVGSPLLAIPYFLLPGFANLKPLGRVLFLFAFALAVLGAFGLDALIKWLRRSRRRPGLAAGIAVAVIAVTVVQLRVYAVNVLPAQEPASQLGYPTTPLVNQILRTNARILPLRNVLPGSTPLVYPLRSALGYESIVPGRVQDFWRLMAGVPAARLDEPVVFAFEPTPEIDEVRLDLLPRAGIEYVVAPPTHDAVVDATGLATVYEGRDGELLRVPGALPRSYLVRGCEEARDARSALLRFQERGFDPATRVILERKFVREAGAECTSEVPPAAGSARIVDESLNDVVLEVDAAAPSFLVVNETWDPGWRATVDGSDVPVLPANSVFRAVPIEPGRHTVQLRYRPRSYELGLVVSGFSAVLMLGALGVLGIRSLRRSRNRRARGATATEASSR